jgi:HD-GYP domain-containing protein (c-di-GMP phosphodiesterase class II)
MSWENFMRLVNIAYVDEGEILARPLVTPNGRILLQEGVKLTRSYIQKLTQLGFDTLFIEDDDFNDVEVYSAVSSETREIAYSSLQNLSKHIEGGKLQSYNLREAQNVVQNIIDDLLHSLDLLGNVLEIRGYDDYTYHHSVNTTIVALIMAISMGWPNHKLLELGMGVLMHDIGKIKVPQEILNKKGTLTQAEFEEIKRHTEYGFDILRNNRDVNLLSAHVAFQHQERWDGTGYPRGLKGNQIHEYGRIAAVADVYEALTSKRVYRNAMQPYEAYEYVMANSGTHFEPNLVKNCFTRYISPYPSGSGIRLSNGQRGNVVRQNISFPTRPYVRMTHQGEIRMVKPIDYNLAEHPSIMILGIENK